MIADNPRSGGATGNSCYYPDSGKWAVAREESEELIVKGTETDYFDGEEFELGRGGSPNRPWAIVGGIAPTSRNEEGKHHANQRGPVISGLCAGIMAVLTVQHGWDPWLAILAGLLAGTTIGLINGFFNTYFGIPSFVVTLAGLIAWQGALLLVLGETGTINLPPSVITDLTSTFYGDAVGWTLAVVVTAGTLGAGLLSRRRRQRAGLEPPALAGLVFRTVLVGAAMFIGVAILLSDRGVPLAAIILLGLTGLFAFITERTRFGRHIYAVGGNAEAARRAGIRVTRVRVTVFAIGATMAAAGGIMAASRLIAVNQSSGSGDILLNAIAGPVIAGTSLFGGRGSVWSALLGALVIGSISNGINLLGLESSVRFMITGGVLLAAVTLDALSRRRRSRVSVT